MLTELQAGPYTVRGISVGGVYTSLQVPELGVVLDAGIPIRSFASTDRLFLSHGHSDHASALGSLLGIRQLIGKERPPQVFLPAEVEPAVHEALAALGRVHHTTFRIDAVPLRPGDEVRLHGDWWVRAFRTHHSAPSLGYQFLRRVARLRAEHLHLPGPEIARLRKAGADLFDEVEHLELAYATDTRSEVLESAPFVLDSRVLILECTYVSALRTVEQVRAYHHIHVDEVLARAERFHNEHLVLMHFSQAHSPAEVHEALAQRLPPSLWDKVRVFAPESGRWFG